MKDYAECRAFILSRQALTGLLLFRNLCCLKLKNNQEWLPDLFAGWAATFKIDSFCLTYSFKLKAGFIISSLLRGGKDILFPNITRARQLLQADSQVISNCVLLNNGN